MSTGTCYAAIFISQQSGRDDNGYSAMADKMVESAKTQPGFIKLESVKGQDGKGVTISYWDSLDSIQKWRGDKGHQAAQQKGKDMWYSQYDVQICQVLREYSMV